MVNMYVSPVRGIFQLMIVFAWFMETGQGATINVPGNFTMIQAAIDAAMAGDTVLVDNGTYNENLDITESIKLLSVNGREFTTITGIPNTAMTTVLGTIIVRNNVDDVQIGASGQGFTIQGLDNTMAALESSAIYYQGAHSGTVIQGNDIVANGGAGLTTEFNLVNTDFFIDDNIFSGQTFFDPPGPGGLFVGANFPLQLVVINGNMVSNVTFTNNDVIGTTGGFFNDTTPLGNTLVTIDSSTSTITGNVFNGRTTRFGSQLRVRRSTGDTIISENTFIGDQNPIGLFLADGAGFMVTLNTFAGFGAAISFGTPVPTGLFANRNSITGNDPFGFFAPDATFHATCNWWGDVSGPSGDNLVGTGDLAFGPGLVVEPWLVGADIQDAPCTGISPSQSPSASPSTSFAPTASAAPSSVPTTSAAPSSVPTTSAAPSSVPTTSAAPSSVPTTSVAPSSVPTTSAAPSLTPTILGKKGGQGKKVAKSGQGLGKRGKSVNGYISPIPPHGRKSGLSSPIPPRGNREVFLTKSNKSGRRF